MTTPSQRLTGGSPVGVRGHWQDPDRMHVLLTRAKQQVIIIGSSVVMITSEPWRTVLLPGPWVRTEVSPGASPDLLPSALLCPLLSVGTESDSCLVCCAGLDHTKPLSNYLNWARQDIAAGRDVRVHCLHSCPGQAQRPAASGHPSKAVLYM